ncbi:MAG: type III-B CRISPR module RAMP protein Cmr1 [Armatimonadota bacterium]
MGRASPSAPAPQWQEPKREESITLHLKLITPLFGGGYEAREVDPVCIIRSATIRGHLRFWWRALYGGQYRSSEELFRAESALWGATAEEHKECAGKVSLRVVKVEWNQQNVTVNDFRPRGSPAKVGPEAQYLLYVFQEQKKDNIPSAKGAKDVQFTLRVTFHDVTSEQRTQVENTLKAWIAFGGIGARTRRGCGALTVTDERQKWLPPAEPNAQKEWFAKLLPPLNQGGHPRFTLLHGASIVCGGAKDAEQAANILHELGSFWACFRKGHVGRGETYTPMAGCKWQDYRGALMMFNKRGGTAISLCKPYLGLPIVYQSFRNAPFAPTLEAQETGRMASPIILKPMALADGRICPVCAVLKAPQPRSIRIKPPDKEVTLQVNSNDRVLGSLGVTHPLDAVVKAAELQWGEKAFIVGGGS